MRFPTRTEWPAEKQSFCMTAAMRQRTPVSRSMSPFDSGKEKPSHPAFAQATEPFRPVHPFIDFPAIHLQSLIVGNFRALSNPRSAVRGRKSQSQNTCVQPDRWTEDVTFCIESRRRSYQLSGSRWSRHVAGISSVPTARATMLPTIAQVVSTSPPTRAVVHMASQ